MDEKLRHELNLAFQELSAQDAGIRQQAAARLGELGITHPKVIDALRKLASDDPSEAVQAAAVRSLARLQPLNEAASIPPATAATPTHHHLFHLFQTNS